MTMSCDLEGNIGHACCYWYAMIKIVNVVKYRSINDEEVNFIVLMMNVVTVS